MANSWAVLLNDASAATGLRSLAGVEILERGNELWARGPSLTADTESLLLGLRCMDRFEVESDLRLRRSGESLHSGELPSGTWTPIREWLQVELPAPRMTSGRIARLNLTMQRTADERQASLLLVSAKDWFRYGSSAPQTRLDRLLFAASRDGRVLVKGVPLPPIPGQAFVLDQGVALPAGWTWSPAVSVATLRKLLEVEDGELVLIGTDGSWEVLRKDEFVAARRSAIRETCRTVKAGSFDRTTSDSPPEDSPPSSRPDQGG